MLLALATAALAFDSEPQSVLLQDDAELFTAAEFSSGYLPSGSPLAVEFRIEALGGGAVSMEGEGNVAWPDPVTLSFTGEPGSGIYLLDASIDAVTSVYVDLSDWGYTGTFEIDRRSMAMDGATFFDPFTLDTRLEVTDTPQSLQVVDYSYDVFGGFASLEFDATLDLVVTANFEGVQWQVNEGTITSENEGVLLQPERAADFLVDGVFRALWEARMEVVFTPTMDVCASIFGCIEVASFEVPLEIVSDSFEQDMPLQAYAFPMPLLAPGIDAGDLGDVQVGTIATLEVPLANEGHMDAYGEATIQGTGEFTVYPETFNAVPGTEDGVVVTFAPSAEGEQSATLVLTSNDPSYPTLEIPLTANGFVPEAESDEDYMGDVGETVEADVSTCGCNGAALSGASAGQGAIGLLAALGLLLRRRRA